MAIDKAKGIICKPMPRTWHDRHAVNKIEDEDTRIFYRSIVADKKPYFMRYIYPALMKQYNTYIKKTKRNALREFGMTVDELRALPEESLTEHQRDFLQYYDYRMPVGVGNCVVNRICRRFEQEFDGSANRGNGSADFDYSFMKSDKEYSRSNFYDIRKLYLDYNVLLQEFAAKKATDRIDKYDAASRYDAMSEDFLKKCSSICPDAESLCNIVLDLCYTKQSTKKFAWDMCGEDIIHNLLRNNNNIISFPVLDPSGDIEYCGKRYSLKSKRIEVNKN